MARHRLRRGAWHPAPRRSQRDARGFSAACPGRFAAAKWPDSILALHTSNGTLCGYFQAIGNDLRDLDFGASPVLYGASTSDSCTTTSTVQPWVSEPSKNAKLYTLERGGTSCLKPPPAPGPSTRRRSGQGAGNGSPT
jgi:glucose dehydrogenase